MTRLHLFFACSILSLALFSCKGRHDLDIPDQVNMKKTAKHQLFPGSRVSAVIPPEYRLVNSLGRFQKDDSTFIQVLESPVTNFDIQKSVITKSFDEAVKSGKTAKYYYKKEFRFGKYDAILYYGPDLIPNHEEIAVCFGDKNFSVMVLSKFKADTGDRDKIMQMILSVYFDAEMKLDPTSLANFSLDLSQSEFAFSSNISQMYFYTIGGKGDPANNPHENLIMVISMPPIKNVDGYKLYAERMLQNSAQNGIELKPYKGKQTVLNGNFAYEIETEGKIQGRTGKVYLVATGNSNSAVLFLGSVFDRQEELMKQVREIAAGIQFKTASFAN